MALPSLFFASLPSLPCCGGGGAGHDASVTSLLLAAESVSSPPRYDDCGSSSYFLGAALASLWAWSLLALAFGLSFVIPYAQSLRRYPPLRYNNNNNIGGSSNNNSSSSSSNNSSSSSSSNRNSNSSGNGSREEEEDNEDQPKVVPVACPSLEQPRALAEVDPASSSLSPENRLENSVDASACSGTGLSQSLKRSASLPLLWLSLESEKLAPLRQISTTSDLLLLLPPLSCNNIAMVRPRKTQPDLREPSSSSSSSSNETLLFSSIVHSNSSPFLTRLRNRKPKLSQLESQSINYCLPQVAIGRGWENPKSPMGSATFEQIDAGEELSQTREKMDGGELKGKAPELSTEMNSSFDLGKDSKEAANEVDCLLVTANTKGVVNSLADLSVADISGPEFRPERGNMTDFVELLTELEDADDLLRCSSYSCLKTRLEASSEARVCPPCPPSFQTQIDVNMAKSLNVQMCSGDVGDLSDRAGSDGAMNTIRMRELQPELGDAGNLPSCFQTQVDDNMVEGPDVQTCPGDAGGDLSIKSSLGGVINMIEAGDLQTESEDAVNLPFCSQTQAYIDMVEKIDVDTCIGDTIDLSTQANLSLDYVMNVIETSGLQMESGDSDLPSTCFPTQVDENTSEKIDIQMCSADTANLSVRAGLGDVNMIGMSDSQMESGDAGNLSSSSFQTQEDVNMEERLCAQSCAGDTANLSLQASSDCVVNTIETSNLQTISGDVNNVLFSCFPTHLDVNTVKRLHEQMCSRDAGVLSVQSSLDGATKRIEISDSQTESGEVGDLSYSCIQTQVDVNTVERHDVQISSEDTGNLSVQASFDGVTNLIETSDLQSESEDVLNVPFPYLQHIQEDVNTDEELDVQTISGDNVNLSLEVNLGSVINTVETSNLQMESGDAVDFPFSCFQTEAGVNVLEKLVAQTHPGHIMTFSVEPSFNGVMNTFETIGLQSESGDSIDSPLSCFLTQVDVNEAVRFGAQICKGDTANLSVEASFDGVINMIETHDLQMESGVTGDLSFSSFQSQEEQMSTETEINLLEDAKLGQGKLGEGAKNVGASSSCPETGDLDISKVDAKDAEASTWWDMDAVLIEPNIEDTHAETAAAGATEENEWNRKPKLINNWFSF